MQTVLSRAGNNATSVNGHQVLTKCLLLVFFGETCSRRSDFGNGAKRCEQGTATRSLTLCHTPLSERDRLFSVQSLGPSHATLPVHTRYVTSARVAGGGKIKGQIKGLKNVKKKKSVKPVPHVMVSQL